MWLAKLTARRGSIEVMARGMPFPVRFEQRKSAATGWCRAFACFAAVLAMLAALAHRFGLLETIDFLNVLPLVVVLAALALGVISSTLTGIYSAAVYRFAAEGEVAGGFSAEMIQSAFRAKK